jgi:hypothetical protein
MCTKCNNEKGATVPEGLVATKEPKPATIKHAECLARKLKRQNAPRYVVVKTSRSGSNRTYTGPTWEEAGMLPPTVHKGLDRHALYLFKKFKGAEKIAKRLSEFNPVGFMVEIYEPPKETQP